MLILNATHLHGYSAPDLFVLLVKRRLSSPPGQLGSELVAAFLAAMALGAKPICRRAPDRLPQLS